MGERLAVFSVREWAFSTVRDWAGQAGHEIALLVTTTGETAPSLRNLGSAGSATTVMAVPEVAACRAALADLEVDLGVVFTFRRIPEAVAGLPRCGTVNLHPALLPAHRGPNGFRALYDGAPRLGATLHRITPELDAGPILAQASEATPADVEPVTALETLKRAAGGALRAGVPRALAGERGEEQDPAAATRAEPFTEDDAVLDLGLTAHLFQCRLSALILAGRQPSMVIDDERQPVRAARHLRGLTAQRPGVIQQTSRRAIAAAADGVLEVELGRLPF